MPSAAITLVPMERITHAHAYRSSRDCDGKYERDYIWFPREGKTFAEVWTETVARESSADWHVRFTAERTTDPDGYPVLRTFAVTEEGYAEEEYVGCDDDQCDPNWRRYRDHTAEAMGY